MRRISGDQEHEFARQNNLFQRHRTRRQCESYESCSDYCPDHSKISTAEVWHGIGEQRWGSDQCDKKSGPGRFPLILQYWYRAVSGQKREETSFATKMSKGLRLALCLYSVIAIFAPALGLDEIRMLDYCTERQNAQIVCTWRPVHLCEKDRKMRKKRTLKYRRVRKSKRANQLRRCWTRSEGHHGEK